MEPLVSAIAKRKTNSQTVQIDVVAIASRKNETVPETAEMNNTKFLGNVSASHPKPRERGTPKNSKNPKINAPDCASIPFHTRIGIMCNITPDLAVSLMMLPINSSQ